MTYPVIKTALASFGMSGQIFHAPFISAHPAFELTTILERSKNLSKDKYPTANIVRDFNEIIEDANIQLVIVNTPSYLHYPMAKAALLAGKNVVVEKPFTATVAEGEELIQIAKSKQLILSVYHNRRLEGDFLTAKKIITENTIGNINKYQVQLRRYRPEPGPKKWKESAFPAAGLLYDIGSHFIDEALHLFGSPQEIQADLQIQRVNGTVNDYFNITFKYPELEVNFLSDMLTKNKDYYSMILKGEKGTFKKKGHDPQEQRLASGDVNFESLGIDFPTNHGIINDSKEVITEKGNYYKYYENLSKAIYHLEPLFVSPESALEVIKIIESISSHTKK